MSPSELVVVEACIQPKAYTSSGLDRLYIGTNLVAVIDGATPKFEPIQGLTTQRLLDAVQRALQAIEMSGDPISELSAFVGRGLDLGQIPSDGRWMLPSATIVAVNATRREVWRIGDPWLSINGVLLNPGTSLEQRVSKRRQEILREAIKLGAAENDLRTVDVGREAVLDELKLLNKHRNPEQGEGFGALDGLSIPARFMEVWRLDEPLNTIIMASDGYLNPADSLECAEDELRQRLLLDPLLMNEPPATKGLMFGQNSFDDRSYLRVIESCWR